jgi:hypothetical protein
MAAGRAVRVDAHLENMYTAKSDHRSPDGFPMVFMHGGMYKICYAADGQFGAANAAGGTDNFLPMDLKVIGVSSDCDSHDCLKDERWECWYPRLNENQVACELNDDIYDS